MSATDSTALPIAFIHLNNESGGFREECVYSSNTQNTQKKLAGISLPIWLLFQLCKAWGHICPSEKTVYASTNKLLQKAENDSLLHNGSVAPK